MNMNNMTTVTIDSVKEVADDIIIQNFAKFQDTMSLTELFAMNKVSMMQDDNRGLAVFHMKKQELMFEVLQYISDNLNVCILYSYKTKNERVHKVILYSLPLKDEMFMIALESEQYGIVEEMNVTFFSSIEIMFNELRKGLEYADVLATSEEINMNETQELTKLYSQFV